MAHYIDADKLTKAIEDKGLDCSFALKMERLDTLALIDELKQEQLQVADASKMEQEEVNIEEEIENEWKKCYPTDEGMGLESANIVKEQFDAIAYRLIELGRNARKEE